MSDTADRKSFRDLFENRCPFPGWPFVYKTTNDDQGIFGNECVS